MDVQTDSERVRTSRKVVLEFLGSSVDVSLAGPAAPDGSIGDYMARYGADPSRYGPPAAPAAAGERDAHEAGHHHAASGDASAATVAQPTKIDNDLYVRDYSKCILCYKCVEACGEDAQNTFAIAVAGRGFDARISTEQAVPLPESAPVSTAATASASARPGRSWPSPSTTCGRPAPGIHRSRPSPRPSARIAAWVARGAARPGRPDPQGHLAAGLVGDRGAPLHQGPLRLRVRQRAPEATDGLTSPQRQARRITGCAKRAPPPGGR